MITPEIARKLGEAMSEEIRKRLFLWHSLPVQTRVLIEMGLIKNPLDSEQPFSPVKEKE